MGQTEINLILLIVTVIIFVFIAGVIIFIIQYRRRKLLHEIEKRSINEQHHLDILYNQQQTMQHIGTEIHDNVGQKLTLASLYAKQLSIDTSNLEKKINAISNIIDESLTDLRQLSKTLTNPELANASLLTLLNEEAKRINATGICYILVTADGTDIILPQAEKNTLFRLLQEFIQNSLKHSGCRKIFINLQQANDQLNVSASDDGKGFNTNNIFNGIGLQNMKRRADNLKAIYHLKSEEGKGTQLSLQLPLDI